MADFQFDQFVDVLDKTEPIRGDAKKNIGKLLAHEPKRLHGFDRIGERIAWAGNPDHGQLRHLRVHRLEVGHGLERRQKHAGNTGAGFIGTIEGAIAIIALQIAFRRHRQVDPRRFSIHVRVEAGMIGKVQFGFERVQRASPPGWVWHHVTSTEKHCKPEARLQHGLHPVDAANDQKLVLALQNAAGKSWLQKKTFTVGTRTSHTVEPNSKARSESGVNELKLLSRTIRSHGETTSSVW